MEFLKVMAIMFLAVFLVFGSLFGGKVIVAKIRCDARESLGFTAVYRGFTCFVSQPDGTWKEVK
jgi:hypothetical protein